MDQPKFSFSILSIGHFIFWVQTMAMLWDSLIHRGEEGSSKTYHAYVLNIFRKLMWCVNWHSDKLLAESDVEKN